MMTKVLVVEGLTQERAAIVEALIRLANVAVLGAVPGVRSAMYALAEAQPDVVVTGVELVDGDSMELVEAARRRVHPPAIVVIESDPSREEWQRHLAAGADRVVDRDRDLAELRDIVAALAARPRNDEVPIAYAPARVDLATLVMQTIANAHRTLPADVGLTVEVQGNVRPIRGIAAQLEQLVRVLVVDAAKAMPSGGDVRVRVRRTNAAAALLEVSDSRRTFDNALLDLTFVHDIARLHAAAVKIVGRPDGGATVTVIFPSDEPTVH